MSKRVLSLALALVLAVGLAVPAFAAGPSFTDVPESYWGYADIEAVAQAGYMNGTGNGEFSPEMKVSVAQFLTLLGRLVFPDVKTEGNDWFGPYVSAAQEAGLLTGSQVDTGNVEAEISRYDMAVILRAAAKKLGVAEKAAQSSEVTDYLDIPTRYAEAVLAVYGMGLIKGDDAGNFNGSNTMMRAEVATVIMRLAKAKPDSGSQGGATTEPEKPVEPQAPDMVHVSLAVKARRPVPYSQAIGLGYHFINDSAKFKLFYTEDGGKTSSLIAEGYSQSYTPETSWDDQTLEFDVDRNAVNAGKGVFYLSGEMDYEGIHYATHDLRTDGRTAIVPLDMEAVLRHRLTQHVNATEYANMVPAATGYQRKITLDRSYGIDDGRNVEAQCRYFANPEDYVPVTLWTQTPLGGTLLASAPLDSDGKYHMEFSIDVLDYQPDLACYRVFIVDADDGTVLGTGRFETLRQMISANRGKID